MVVLQNSLSFCLKQSVKYRSFAKMRAIWVNKFGPPENLELLDFLVPPKITADNQILIQIHSAGVNPVDTYIRAGTYPRVPNLPYTPGADGAGVVEAVGKNVTKVKAGDRVFCTASITGTYAEMTLADELHTWQLPDSLSFAQGASIGVPYFTAYKALFLKCHAKPGDTVLIHGASGAVGIAACQLCKAHNIRVLGTASSQSGRDLVKNCGAEPFDHSDKDYVRQIMNATPNGEGVDVILEMLVNINLPTDLSMMRQNGRCSIIGSRGATQIDPRAFMGKELTVNGVALMTTTTSEWKEMGAALEQLFQSGQLNPIVGKEYSLKESVQAHIDVIEHKGGTTGKLVINTRDQAKNSNL